MHFHYMAFTNMTFVAACILTTIFLLLPRNNVTAQSIISLIYSNVIFRFRTGFFQFMHVPVVCVLRLQDLSMCM